MRTLLLLICIMFTTACTQQTNFDSEELSLIEKEASELLSKYPEPNFDFCQWPLKLIHFWPIKLTHLRSGFANFLLQSIAFSSEHKYV